MLRVYAVSLDVVRGLRPVLDEIGRRDPDLARQVRRALTSVPLNIAEGSASRGRNRAARYHTNTKSMREVMAGLDVAVALGYLRGVDAGLLGQMRQVYRTLLRNALG